MKKLFFAILGLILISIASVYLSIPNEIIVSEVEQVESSERIIAQYINNSAARRKWWPTEDGTSPNDTLFKSGGYKFDFNNPGFNSIKVLIRSEDFKNSSTIKWTTYADNIIEISWRTSSKAGNNPVKRFLQYQEARRIKAEMSLITERFLKFIVQSKNIYSFDIERQIVKDTILATSSRISPEYPATRQMYELIKSVKNYVNQQDAKTVNAPMLNIFKNPEGTYKTMIALPINKYIKPTKDVLINRMVAGNILVAEVKGGPESIEDAFRQIKTYMDDFKLSSPAIPFQSLITDRSAEPDTSKWITKIYYPIY